MNYPGGKNGSGTFQTLINLIPPHRTYVEAFLGSGAIMRLKRPAPSGSIGIDSDGEALSQLASSHIPNLMLIKSDALDWLTRNPLPADCFLYLDPPYLMSTRSSKRPYYRHEFAEEGQHAQLLDLVLGLKCMVMISGYYSDLYANALKGWRTVTFKSITHGGRSATEWVWLNYPEPFALHDYRYLGQGYRERENIRRMQKRTLAKLQGMKPLERYAMLETIEQWRCAAVPPATPMELAGPAADTGENVGLVDRLPGPSPL
jgi:hypothetical protein